MAKRARLCMADYKEVVNQARLRRKIKEKENRLLFLQNGAEEMYLRQEKLMASSSADVIYDASCRRNEHVMSAVVVPDEESEIDVYNAVDNHPNK
jgi:hypothetical protein